MKRDKEIWKAIEGHPGYEVSSHGQVRSLDRTIECLSRWGNPVSKRLRGMILKPRNHHGYRAVSLGAGTDFYIHRLVALAFVPGYAEGLEVNHDDGDRANNYFKNLQWMTSRDNNRHAFAKLPRKPQGRPVPVIVGGRRYETQAEAARAHGISPQKFCVLLKRGGKVQGQEVRRG